MAPDEEGGGTPCKVDVEYEWLPPKCTACMSLGHSDKDCALNKTRKPTKPTVNVYVPKVNVSQPQLPTKGRKTMKPVVEDIPKADAGDRHVDQNHSKQDERGKAIVIYNAFDALHLIDDADSADQFIHCRVTNMADNESVIITVVYGASEVIDRRNLWTALETLAQQCSDIPWLVGGILMQYVTLTNTSMRSLWKRLDRILINGRWLARFPSAYYHSLTPRTSDHSPLNIWHHEIVGIPMYAVTRKLKALKPVFRLQRRNKGDLTMNVQLAKGGTRRQLSVDIRYLRPWARHCITDEEANQLLLPLSADDVKQAVFDIADDKAPGPDGYSLRPISCCNVLYKIIAKLLVPKISVLLDKIVSPCQTAFILGRSIGDNIMLAQELFSRYNQMRLPPRCALKVDIRKAYDTVEWDFLLAVLQLFGFPPTFTRWIEEFVSTTSFSIGLNGKPHGFFAGARGLRQGDPLSPYLFVLVMEALHLGFLQRIEQDIQFTYHWKCESSKEGHLPMRYLGLPLISSRLTISDCQPLISKIDARIKGWEGISLSYAGRVQIIKSVLSALSLYWASAFILPKKVINEIEKRLRTFLWKGTTSSGYAKWLYQDRLRERSIWTIREHGGSWGWRKILRLRPFLRAIVDYQIGNGDRFFVWQDPWHHLGPLIERFPQGPRHLRLEESAKLSLVISAGEWQWPTITDLANYLPQTNHGYLTWGCAYYAMRELRNLIHIYSSDADLVVSAFMRFAERFAFTGPIEIGQQILNGRHGNGERILSIDLASSVSTQALYRLWRIPWVEGETSGNRRQLPLDIRFLRSWARHVLTTEEAGQLILAFSPEDVKQAVFDIAEDKAPGPDGFSSGFFKAAWSVVGHEVTTAVLDFFSTGKLLKQVNSTLLALIPKGAFIPGRSIGDNIMLAQELFTGYNQARLPPRCALKVDIRKAYDTVEWDFLLAVLQLFGFPPTFTRWIEECVTTTSFSIGLNGNPHGFFTGARGLRQGDPLSPYLFVLVMEVLHMGFLQLIEQDGQFKYHWKCEPAKVFQLGFADDLLLFSRADLASINVLKMGLDRFAEWSGLRLNVQKSHVIISRSAQGWKNQILEAMGFQEGELPMRYLGLPLLSSRLSISDCQPLLLKIDARINGWEGLSLSYAGRIQIIKSVLSALSLYWASAFILPKAVIKQIEKRLRTFLWKGNSTSGYAKVAWKDVCKPIMEGGQGIKDIEILNRALMAKKLCDVIRCDRTSIWVDWLQHGRLRDTSIWTVDEKGGSWGWRKLLRLRTSIQPMTEFIIGDGRTFYLWKDPWHQLGPLISRLPRAPSLIGIGISTKLQAVIDEGQWQWPFISNMECMEIIYTLPQIHGWEDRIKWQFPEGRPTTQALYRLFCPPGPKVGWTSLLSGSLKIPRHTFILWLAIQEKLPTTDKPWLNHLGGCILCDDDTAKTHTHLFFRCRFSRRCLTAVRQQIRFAWPNREWARDVEWASRKWRGKHIVNVAYRALLGACIYHIWRERNLRRFEQTHRPAHVLALCILDDIRQMILNINLLWSISTYALYRLWRIPWPVGGETT
ncbi:UNVERIFIED_CONTAM: hypothetical protein Sindi_0081300 [Sesamum indicum]